ncbi:MAG: DNA modification methylase [Candidatus Pacebacteria bacterium]|nr:DNA modification methylase [Candidatus Paceibacterota bacterium]
MKKLQWQTVQKRVNDLIPQEINPRVITDKQMLDLKRSLKKYNLVEIPAIDLNGKILAGHQRIKALQLLNRGDELIDVRIPNRKLTEDESKQYLIASNALGGDWDFESLRSFGLDILMEAGFDQIQLAKFWDDEVEVKEDSFDVEKELKKIKKPKTRLGDIIKLGNHKLICGDSTDPNTIKKLLGEEKVSMIYSDPVYNIKIDYDGGIGGNKDYGGNVNDSRTFEEYKLFIKDSLSSALSVSNPDTHVFYWCDQIYIGLIQDVYRLLGISNRRVCLWLKNNQNPVPTVAFNKAYEPVIYGTRGKPYLAESITNLNEVMNKEFTTGNNLLTEVNEFIDIWTAKRLSAKDYEHATSKPPQLHEKAIKRCTRPGDIILDSFLGSGSTLLAGEQLGRCVYGCDLEPRFCDLIVKRYEAFTDNKAITIDHYEKE